MLRFAFVFVCLLAGTTCWGWQPPPENATQGAKAIATKSDASDAPTEDDEETMSVWMEKKLQHSQAILRGLAMGDFDDVKYNAGRLKVLSRVEGFVRRRNPEYRLHLNMFTRLTAEIERQADQENIEGATLAFNQLTVSCVECHKSLRNESVERSDLKQKRPETSASDQ